MNTDNALPKTRIGERKIAWLAGLIDGEGCISLGVIKKTGVINPYLEIGNTNDVLAKEAHRVMQALTEKSVRVYAKNQQNGYRPCWRVQATSDIAIRDILTAVLDDLVGKRPQAELMLRFLESHPSLGVKGHTGYRAAKIYTPEHYRMASQMKHLNRRYAKGEWTVRRTTERVAPAEGEETVCSPGRPGEAAEMPARPALAGSTSNS